MTMSPLPRWTDSHARGQEPDRSRRSAQALIDRVLAEYREMPGLCLTVQQASRLWQINLTDCTRILELLVAHHVLKRSATGVFIADDLRCSVGSTRREAQK